MIYRQAGAGMCSCSPSGLDWLARAAAAAAARALPLASERLVGNPRRAHREEQQWCALVSGVGHPPPGGVADQAELSTAWIVLEESVEV